MKETNQAIPRWRMNRLGLVNFWLYDEEEYSFEDGKLLLRGQNGSGKSITTQSFVPFILDGNRKPEHLDPSGSKDRRMEYYFLGNGDREEATGYLYLEFKRGDEYRTIGIGQRAREGKKDLDFWGFILQDGRRIGEAYDIRLTEEYGNQYIPLSKKQLKNRLGEENQFFEKPGEYMRGVNKAFFGFPRDEQYAQFIELLIKIRAPKLSNVFKPSTVYSILNESIQTLTDADISTMVDAMEKLDEIELKLDNLKRTGTELEKLLREYDRYNRFMLSSKAEEFLRAADEAAVREKEYAGLLKSIRTLEESIKRNRMEREEAEGRLENGRARIRAFRDSEIYRKLENVKQIEKEYEEKGHQLERKRRTVAELSAGLTGLEKEIEKRSIDLAQLAVNAKELGDSLEEDNRIADFSQHNNVIELINIFAKLAESGQRSPGESERSITEKLQNAGDRLDVLERAAAELEKRIRDISVRIRLREGIRAQYSEASEKAERKKSAYENSCLKLNAAQERLDNEKDRLIEELYRTAAGNTEFRFSDLLEQLKAVISAFDGRGSLDAFRGLIMDQYQPLKDKLVYEEAGKELLLDELKKEMALLTEEYRMIEEKPEPEPPLKDGLIRTREALREKNIHFCSFYELIDFAKDLTDREQALLEEQLELSGLLNALVILPEDKEKAEGILGENEYLIPLCGKRAEHPVSLLVPAGEAAPEYRDIAGQILARIGSAEAVDDAASEDVLCLLGRDGYFRHGILEGHAAGEAEKARFIGRPARLREKEERLKEKREQIEKKDQETAAAAEELEMLRRRQRRLDAELEKCPKTDLLDLAFSDLKGCEKDCEHTARSYEEALSEAEAARRNVSRAENEIRELSEGLSYVDTEQAYDEAAGAVSRYMDKLRKLRGVLREYSSGNEMLSGVRDKKAETEKLMDNALYEQHGLLSEYEKLSGTLTELRRILDSEENQNLRREMEELERTVTELDMRIRTLGEEISGESSRLDERNARIEEEKMQAEESGKKANTLEGWFLEEFGLQLIQEISGQEESGQEQQTARSIDLARSIRRQIGDMSAGNEQDRYTALKELVDKSGALLSEYGMSMRDQFETSDIPGAPRRRKIIEAVWKGSRMSILYFRGNLEKMIGETSELIREKDRELFEKILSDTVSRKLTDRIQESREWIREMSGMMRNIETSMGLAFSLEWQPRSAEGEGQLSTKELEKLLIRDREVLTREDIDRVTEHFRSRIRAAKTAAEMAGETPDYAGLVRGALDFREWFEFRMFYFRQGGQKKELTNSAFNQFSGGERAMAMYIPLFAAINAQYRKAELSGHPRLIALDEAFAGVDEKNISSMFELVETMDFDYIMNSQALWGCYESVPALRIAELQRPNDEDYVTVIQYRWNGKKKVLA